MSRFVKEKIAQVVANKVVDGIADAQLIEENEDLSDETKKCLREIPCALTKAISVMGGPYIMGKLEGGGVGTNEMLKTDQVNLGWTKLAWKWIQTPVGDRTHQICGKWETDTLIEDDLSGGEDGLAQSELKQFMLSTAMAVTRNETILKMDDSDYCFANNDQAVKVMKDLKYQQGVALPQSYNTDFNMETDESFSRIFFYGIGAPLMAKQEKVTDPEHLKYGPLMIDMTFLKDLDMREGGLYKKYGARVHFDKNQKVTAIYDCDEDKLFLPGQPGWDAAKMQAKVTAFTLLTVREHLAQTHLIVSNDASREIIKTLHPMHPIRRLLSIFTFNAITVNAVAFEVLVPENCVIHRAVALSGKGMKQVFDNSYTTSIAYKPFTDREIKNPAVQELIDSGRFPYVSSGNDYYEITRTMVRNWLSEAGGEATDDYAISFYEAMRKKSFGQAYELPPYSPDNMVNLISSVIFAVTGYHELIGHVPDYTDLPTKAGFRLTKKDPTQIDVQSFLLAAFISASTSYPAPQLLADFPNFIGAGGAPKWERSVWTEFLDDIKSLSERVQKAERQRDFEFKYMDPSKFECSVSV